MAGAAAEASLAGEDETGQGGTIDGQHSAVGFEV